MHFFFPTDCLVNSEESKSQNCCSRNHFEGDNFKRFFTEPLYPNHILESSAGHQHLPQPTPNPLPAPTHWGGTGSTGSGSGCRKSTLCWGRVLQAKISRIKSRARSFSEHVSTLPAAHTEPVQGVGCKGEGKERPRAKQRDRPVPKHTPLLGTRQCNWKSCPGDGWHWCSG